MGKFVFKKKAKEEVKEAKATPKKKEREEKKTATKALKKTTTKEKKEEKVAGKRGRQKGVKFKVSDEFITSLSEKFAEYQKNFKGLDHAMNTFVDKGTKSMAKTAREFIQNNTKIAKEFRALLQEAKENMEQVEAD